MALSKDDILNAVAELTVMELVELISAFEEKFGVSAATAVAAGPAVAAAVVVFSFRSGRQWQRRGSYPVCPCGDFHFCGQRQCVQRHCDQQLCGFVHC